MKFSSQITLFLLLVFSMNFYNCSSKKEISSDKDQVVEENCISYQLEPITKVKEYVPEKSGDEYYFEINFLVKNGCGGFGNIVEKTVGDSLIISINAKYSGCICTLAMQELSTIYEWRKAENVSVIKFIGDKEEFEFRIKS